MRIAGHNEVAGFLGVLCGFFSARSAVKGFCLLLT